MAKKHYTEQDRENMSEEFKELLTELTETQKSLLLRYAQYLKALKPGAEAMPIAQFVETLPKQLVSQFRPLVAQANLSAA